MSSLQRAPVHILRMCQLSLKSQTSNARFFSSFKNSLLSSQATFFSKNIIRSVRETDSLQAIKNWLADIKSDRPLALLFPWVHYPPNAVQRFVEVYNSNGFDILTFRYPLLVAGRAHKAISAAQNLIVPCLLSIPHSTILLHGFCAGILPFTQAIALMSENEKQRIFGRVRAQIWDSLIRTETSALGLAQTMVSPKFPRIQNSLCSTLEFYQDKSDLGKVFQHTQDIFDSCPVKANALLLASEADPIGSVENTYKVEKSWTKNRGIQCSVKVWKNSGHVGHMKMYPEEYWGVVERFLQQNGFLVVDGMWKNKQLLAGQKWQKEKRALVKI